MVFYRCYTSGGLVLFVLLCLCSCDAKDGSGELKEFVPESERLGESARVVANKGKVSEDNGPGEDEPPETPPEVELDFDDDGVAPFDDVPAALMADDYVILLRGGQSCDTMHGSVFERAFRAVAREEEVDVDFLVVNRDGMVALNTNEWPYSYGHPEVLYLKEGSVVDRQIGSIVEVEGDGEDYNKRHIRHLLARHDLISESEHEFSYEQDIAAMDFSRGGYVATADAEESDLRERSLRGVSFSGTNLRGADLRGADLEGALFAGVDLMGAELDGANLSNTVWLNTRCPDGGMSDEDGC